MRVSILPALGIIALAPSALLAQDKDFQWSGKIDNGHWLYVHNMNGGVHVERGTGDRVEITAVKNYRRGNPDDVRIESRKTANGDVIICAFWVEEASCDERSYRSHGNNRNDTSVEFTVRLPANVKLGTSTVNGSVRVEGATDEVRATTVNGRVEAYSSGGPVTASTVNGDVDVRMANLGPSDRDLRFSTVNGSVTLEVPSDLDAELEMRTVNGRLNADFPITVQGRINPRHLRATIGKGGRVIELRTVNGSVNLRKR